jgi:hypothetical protein
MATTAFYAQCFFGDAGSCLGIPLVLGGTFAIFAGLVGVALLVITKS